MRKFIFICCLLFLTFSLGLRSNAQDAPSAQEAAKALESPRHFYHLEFVVQELDSGAKPINSRVYTTTVNTDPRSFGSIRTGSRIPIATGSFSAGEPSASVNTQFQYIDVGVNIDVRKVNEIERQLALDLTAEVSSVANAADPNLHHPVIRQNKWQSVVFIPVGKRTVVFTSDSLDSKGSMQVVVTATPVQ